MSEKVRVEWVENGKPKQFSADVVLYQMNNGNWDIAHDVVRLVVAKEGGTKIVKAFVKREPSVFHQRELQRRRRNGWFLSGVSACAFTLMGAGLTMLLI
jgi:hypothetical protein